MIRYHKSQINGVGGWSHFKLKLYNHTFISPQVCSSHKYKTMQGIDISRLCLDIFISHLPVFRSRREERPRWAEPGQESGWWRQRRGPGRPRAQVRPLLAGQPPVVTGTPGAQWSAWPAECQSVLDRHTVQSSRASSRASQYNSQWSSGAQCHQVTQVTHVPHVTCGCDPPTWGHSYQCCDSLANDCFNEMNISWCYSNMHILGVWFKCHVCHWLLVCVMLYPKLQISAKPHDFIAPPQCRRASNLILLIGHVSRQPVFKI